MFKMISRKKVLNVATKALLITCSGLFVSCEKDSAKDRSSYVEDQGRRNASDAEAKSFFQSQGLSLNQEISDVYKKGFVVGEIEKINSPTSGYLTLKNTYFLQNESKSKADSVHGSESFILPCIGKCEENDIGSTYVADINGSSIFVSSNAQTGNGDLGIIQMFNFQQSACNCPPLQQSRPKPPSPPVNPTKDTCPQLDGTASGTISGMCKGNCKMDSLKPGNCICNTLDCPKPPNAPPPVVNPPVCPKLGPNECAMGSSYPDCALTTNCPNGCKSTGGCKPECSQLACLRSVGDSCSTFCTSNTVCDGNGKCQAECTGGKVPVDGKCECPLGTITSGFECTPIVPPTAPPKQCVPSCQGWSLCNETTGTCETLPTLPTETTMPPYVGCLSNQDGRNHECGSGSCVREPSECPENMPQTTILPVGCLSNQDGRNHECGSGSCVREPSECPENMPPATAQPVGCLSNQDGRQYECSSGACVSGPAECPENSTSVNPPPPPSTCNVIGADQNCNCPSGRPPVAIGENGPWPMGDPRNTQVIQCM